MFWFLCDFFFFLGVEFVLFFVIRVFSNQCL